MDIINRINVLESKSEDVSMFSSALTRKFKAMGIATKNAITKIYAECPKDEQTEAIVKSALYNMIDCGFNVENVTYTPIMATAGESRKATTSWINEIILKEIGTWAMCGLKTKDMNMPVNKYMTRVGLLASASKPFKEVFGKDVDVRRIAVVKDASVVIDAIVDYVCATEGVERDKVRKVVINAFDGHGWIRIDLTNGESITIRAPWVKAFVQAVDFKKVYAWCVKNGVKAEFTDFWGNTRKLKDVDIILTESCFKTAKLYESWEQYCEAFEKLGHEVCVCVREHEPKLKGLPYQQGQTLLGTEDDAISFMMHAKKTIYKYHDPKEAAGLLRGYHKQAAKMYPALLKEKFTAKTIQDMYATKRNDMLGGRIPEMGYNAFLAPDPVAFAQHLFGLPITGYLKAGECFCNTIKAGPVDITRNPHFDNAHVVLNNTEECPLAEGPTMFINIFDMTTIQLRADYDGDHVLYSQDEHLLDLVNRTYDELKNIPIDWDAPSAPKTPITKSAIANYVVNLIHGSEIGLYADALTKMWNAKYDRDVCDWLTYAGNVLIDAAKHGSVKINKPDKVKALNQVSLPLFAMYAKADADHPANSEYWLKERITKTGITLPPRCKYTGSFLDMYSKAVQENVPETLTVEGLEDEIFNPTVLLINAKRPYGKLTGLSKKGIYDPETNSFKECGVFQNIAFRHSTEWNKLVGDTSFFANRREWEEETGHAARKEIIDWAYAQYPEIARSEEMDKRLDDACYDIITRHIFNTKMSDGMNEVIMQAFWRIYGDKAVKVLKTNLNTSIPDFDSEEYDELLDDSND